MRQNNKLASSSGQAFIEMAIFGSIALIAMGFLIQVGLGMNYQQELDENTFRRALLMAKCESSDHKPNNWCGSVGSINGDGESQATVFTQLRDRQIPSPSLGYGIMPRSMVTSSATATWGQRLTFLDDSRDSEPRLVVKVNDRPAEMLRSSDIQDDMIKNIDKHFDAEADYTQTNGGVTLVTSTTTTTDVTLGTSDSRKINSTVSTIDATGW